MNKNHYLHEGVVDSVIKLMQNKRSGEKRGKSRVRYKETVRHNGKRKEIGTRDSIGN
jgi:hypothetical protein